MNYQKNLFLLMATLLVVVLGFSACKGISTKDADASLDSLAIARGYSTGQQMRQQLDFSEMMGQKIDKDQLLKGIADGIATSTDSNKMWYYQGLMIGYQIGSSNNADKVNNKIYLENFQYGMNLDTMKVTWKEDAMREYLNNAEQKLQEKKQVEEQKKKEEEYKANQEEGEKFLEKFKKEDGVKVLPSGVAYKVLKEGQGSAKPTTSDKVQVLYKGTFTNGEVFDQTEDKPISFGVTSVIPGWTEVLQEMTVGEKVKVAIPYDKAYGVEGSGNIEPYKTLVFEIELVAIEPAE